MPVTRKPSSLLTKEQKERIVFLYEKDGFSYVKISKDIGITISLCHKFLLEVGVLRHRNAQVDDFYNRDGAVWSKKEFHYGNNGSNYKYNFNKLSYVEKSLIDEPRHKELRILKYKRL